MKAAPYWDIYNTQLVSLNYGRATWEADPKANGEDHRVEVGDVGYMKNGGFHRLFNILLPGDDSSHQSLGVPDNFTPLKPTGKVTFPRSPIKKGPLHSHSVRRISANAHLSVSITAPVGPSGDFSFSCQSERGAALILFDQAFRSDILSTELFEDCFLTNHDSWITFARRLKRGISLDDLILVTGRDVTTGWAMAAFSHLESNGKFKAGVDVPGALSATFGLSYGWKTDGIVHSHSGPQPVEPPSPRSREDAPLVLRKNNVYDQCVFLRGYCLRRRHLLAPRRMKAAAGYDDLGPGDKDDQYMLATLSEESAYSVSADYNTLSPILDYILDNSDVEVALAHDDDLHPFVRDSSEPEELRMALEAAAPRVIVLGNGVGKIDRRGANSPSSSKGEIDFVKARDHANNNPQIELRAEQIFSEEPSKEPLHSTDNMLSILSDDSYDVIGLEERMKIIKAKIRVVGRIMRVLSILREESDKVAELKSRCESGKLPYGLLALGSESIKDVSLTVIEQFPSPLEPSEALWLTPLSSDLANASMSQRRRGVSESSVRSQVPPPYSPPPSSSATPLAIGPTNESHDSLLSRRLPTPSNTRINTGLSEPDVSGNLDQDRGSAAYQGKWKAVRAKISVIGRIQRALTRIRETSVDKSGMGRLGSAPSVTSSGASSYVS